MKWNSQRRSSRKIHRGAPCRLFDGLISAGVILFSQQLLAADSTSFHQRVLATYDFAPHSLNKEEISAKSKILDAFWTEVTANQAIDLAALREELARPDVPEFFEYDGAKLLLSLSKSRADESIALSAINHADLADLQFLTTHILFVPIRLQALLVHLLLFFPVP